MREKEIKSSIKILGSEIYCKSQIYTHLLHFRYASPGNEEGCGIATSTYISLGLSLGVTLSYGLVALV